MGRKATDKPRKSDPRKVSEWMIALFPKVQNTQLRKMTMDEFAALIGISKATLYAYLRSKEELMLALLSTKLQEIGAYQHILQDERKPHASRLEDVIKQLTAVLPGISNSFLAEVRNHFPTVWESVDAFLEIAFGGLISFYQEGMQTGAFRRISPALLAATDRQFFLLMTNPDFLIKNELTLHEAVKSYIDLRFYGLLAT